MQIEVDDHAPLDRLNRRRNQSGSRRALLWLAAGALLLFAAAVAIGWSRLKPADSTLTSGAESPATGAGAESSWDGDTLTPPDGEPIRLFMVPSGTRLIVHLRPAQLWSDDPRMVELRSSLTEEIVGKIAGWLRNVTHRDPQDIEEVLLAWILGARGMDPQLSVVVSMTQEEPLTDLIKEFGGELLDESAQSKVYVHDDRAVLIRDGRTLAFAPRQLGDELSDWVESPNLNTSDGILALLEHTDRERLITVVGEPADLLQHLDALVPEVARTSVRQLAEWFDGESETVAWSIDAGDTFSSEILLRSRSTVSPTSVSKQVHERMERLPQMMVETVRELNPQRAGVRRIMGRYPAMLEVSRRATVTAVGDRIVRLSTILPPKAGPNLVLATLLTWDQSRQKSREASAEPSPSRPGKSQPLTVADKLQRAVDAEFNRMPLQEAIAYIASEIDLTIEIDGDALKDAGYTKNMPQTFNLGRVSAAAVIREIVGRYQEPGKEMVLIIEDLKQRAILSTSKFAQQQGRSIYQFPR